jgi:hypothetical protein
MERGGVGRRVILCRMDNHRSLRESLFPKQPRNRKELPSYIRIAIVHVRNDVFLQTSGVQVFDLTAGVGDRRRNVLNDHVRKTFEFSEESGADEAKKWTDVELQFRFGQTYA